MNVCRETMGAAAGGAGAAVSAAAARGAAASAAGASGAAGGGGARGTGASLDLGFKVCSLGLPISCCLGLQAHAYSRASEGEA